MLETEYDNYAALSLYESLGFIREKRLYRFYLNGKDAFRLIHVVPPPSSFYSDSDNTDSSGSEAGSPPSGSGSGMLLYHQRRMASGLPPYRAIPVIPYSDDEDDEVSGR
jgi:peptide alpha-N-acetyltransferase